MLCGWSWEELALVRRWERFWNCLVRFGDAAGSLLWELETAIRDSEVSGNPAHELLPLPGRSVTSFLSTHPSSPEGSRRRTAALWVSAVAKAINYLFCAGWTGRFVAVSCPAHLSQAQESCLSQVAGFHPLTLWSRPGSSVDLAPTQAKLGSLNLGCAGQVVARGLSLVDSMVGPAWPRKERMGLLPVVRFLDGKLSSDLSDPNRCVNPVQQWPSVTPIGHVMASDEEWYKIVERGLRLGLHGHCR